jgi:hypothetical protein
MSQRALLRAPGGRVAIAAALLAAVALVAVAKFPFALHDVGSKTRNAMDAELDKKLLLGAGGAEISLDLMREAKERMPEETTYAVVTGTTIDPPTPVTLPWVSTFSRYWLFPREQVPVRDADWLIRNGCSPIQVPSRFTPVYEEAGGRIVLARTA